MRSDNIWLSKTSFEKNCFSAWASTLNMGLINKVDMVCLSPVGYGVQLTFRASALRRSRLSGAQCMLGRETAANLCLHFLRH